MATRVDNTHNDEFNDPSSSIATPSSVPNQVTINTTNDSAVSPSNNNNTHNAHANSWAIGTYIRLKPALGRKKKPLISVGARDVSTEVGETRTILEIDIPPDADPGLLHSNESGKLSFEYDHIFDTNVSQEEIFTIVAREKILDALQGLNCTIFAYGQTGSGKTFTIFGGDSYNDRGLIPRTISAIFNEFTSRREVFLSSKLEMSFSEVYKECVYDLLDPQKRGTSIEQWTPVQIFESENGLILRNINVYEVVSEEDALKLFFMGNSNRMTVSTSMNTVSSRSHAIFTLIIKTETMKDQKKVYSSGKINLVDLAGSERMYKTANSKESMTEAKSINLSLHFLEQVIVSLRQQARQHAFGQQGAVVASASTQHIPYRNSVLTSMLRDSLGGNCRSCFIMTMSLETEHFSETVSTCRFGQRCGEVKVQVHANTEIGLSDQLKEMSAKVKHLEKQLHTTEEQRDQYRTTLEAEREANRRASEPRNLTPEEKAECKSCVQSLLAAAKESVVMKKEGLEEGKSEAMLATETEILLSKSQERLYQSIQGMNKTILVELCTALGGLVQSMYVDRERAKMEEANRIARKALMKLERSQSKVPTSDEAGDDKKRGVDTPTNSNSTTSNGIATGGKDPSTASSSANTNVATGATFGTPVATSTTNTVGSGNNHSLAASIHHLSLVPPATPLSSPSAAHAAKSHAVGATESHSSGGTASHAASNSNQIGGSTSPKHVTTPVKSAGQVANAQGTSSTLAAGGSGGDTAQASSAIAPNTSSMQAGVSASHLANVDILKDGEHFLKKSRGIFKQKRLRYFYVSDDLSTIFWKDNYDAETKKSAQISSFTSVELDESAQSDASYGFELRGPNNASLRLFAVGMGSAEANRALAQKWVKALQSCIQDILSKAGQR